jgi:hypothetical protein
MYMLIAIVDGEVLLRRAMHGQRNLPQRLIESPEAL